MYTLPPESKVRDHWSRLKAGVWRFRLFAAAAGVILLAAGFLFWKFASAAGAPTQGSIFSRAAAAISGTFRGMFALPEDWAANDPRQAAGTPASETPIRRKSAAAKSAGRKISSKKKNSGSQSSGSEIISDPLSRENGSGTASVGVPAERSECGFAKTENPNHKILFSEIAWMGTIKSANDEWIELKNNSGMDLNLAGWQIASEDGKMKIDFADGEKIFAGGYFLLERGGNFLPGITTDKTYSGLLPNGGAHLKIFDAACALADEIDALKGWLAGDAKTKKTMERSSLDLTWHTSGAPGGTPKAENTAAFSKGIEVPSPAQNVSPGDSPGSENFSASSSAPAAAVKILIDAIQITGGSGKANNDFIKLYNSGSEAADISGWQLKKRAQSGTESSVKVFPSGSRIAASGYFLWANSDGGFASSTGANASSGAYLSDNNSIGFFDKSGAIMDAVAWGSGHSNPFVEGAPYPDNPGVNQVLSRKSGDRDTDNNAADFEIRR